MKQLLSLIFIGIILGFTQRTVAQDCAAYYPTEMGSVWELTHYDKKDKKSGSTRHTITSNSNGKMVVKAESFDKKGELIVTSNYNMRCKEDKIELDMSAMMMGSTAFSQIENMEVELTGSYLEIPNTLNVGQQLPDGNIEVAVGSTEGFGGLKMKIDVLDRLVEKKESITVPIGTYDCFKINETIVIKMALKITTRSSTYYADGKGPIKVESFDKKGRLTGYSVRTK